MYHTKEYSFATLFTPETQRVQRKTTETGISMDIGKIPKPPVMVLYNNPFIILDKAGF
jgi:hypothetical protein